MTSILGTNEMRLSNPLSKTVFTSNLVNYSIHSLYLVDNGNYSSQKENTLEQTKTGFSYMA